MAIIATMTTTIFSAKKAKNNFGQLLDEARRSPVTIEKNGRSVAVLLSVEDYNEYTNPKFWAELEKSRRSGRVSAAEIKKRLGI